MRSAVLILLLALAVSCSSVRTPAIVPLIPETKYGEWIIKDIGPAAAFSGKQARWKITAVYFPDSDGKRIASDDIKVSIDDVSTEYGFVEEKQQLSVESSQDLVPGRHVFSAQPSPDSSFRFPSLKVEFESR